MSILFLGYKPSDTFGVELQRQKGIGQGFDFLRLLLAVYIFYGHAIWVATPVAVGIADTPIDGDVFSGWTRPFHVAVLPVFFALSGFLVMGSADRLQHTSTFLAYRMMRIVPALFVEVCISALVLGPMVTTLSWEKYFLHPQTLMYFGNIVGHVTLLLPGVFEKNPVAHYVNVNLWTLPSEFDCYLILAIFMVLGILRAKRTFLFLFILMSLVLFILNGVWGIGSTQQLASKGVLVYSFFCGVVFYHWQNHIPARLSICLLAGGSAFVVLLNPVGEFFAALLLSYVMLYIGSAKIPKLPLFSKGDYSYGIYLYGFPISQALISEFPDTFIENPYRLLIVAFAICLLFSVLSWHLLEKNALACRKYLPESIFPVKKRVVPSSTMQPPSAQ